MLHPNLGAAARFGGDQIGGEGLTVVPTKSVALFSGVVQTNDQGEAEVPIEVPDFNGELRLMAVAWSKSKVGAVDKALTVRDPVPAELALPRFLAPGDQASSTLLIDNVEGLPGPYNLAVDGTGPLAANDNRSVNLKIGEKKTRLVDVSAKGNGVSEITLSVKGPQEEFQVERRYPIQVRSPFFPITQTKTAALSSGEAFFS